MDSTINQDVGRQLTGQESRHLYLVHVTRRCRRRREPSILHAAPQWLWLWLEPPVITPEKQSIVSDALEYAK
jgi:hypothetical protein